MEIPGVQIGAEVTIGACAGFVKLR